MSSMTPTIVFRDGAPILALGGSGGMRIAGNVTQMLLCRLAFEQSARSVSLCATLFHPAHGSRLDLLRGPSSSVSAAARSDGPRRANPSRHRRRLHSRADGRMGPRGGALRLEASGDPRKGGVGLVR